MFIRYLYFSLNRSADLISFVGLKYVKELM